MKGKVIILNNSNHGHFRIEEQHNNHLVVTKELQYQWEFGSDGRVVGIEDLRTGHTAVLLG